MDQVDALHTGKPAVCPFPPPARLTATRCPQELESHPARKSFHRRRILTVLCDEYLSAIVIPTLQSWLEVFTWVDWNHSRTVGFVELKQGLSACNTPEGAPHPLRLCVVAVLISRLSRCSQLDAQHC